MHWIVEPGLFSNHAVLTALALGAMVSIVSAVVGVFTVLRGQSFAGHALTDVATAGGAAASLAVISPLIGFVGGGILGAGAMEAIGVQRVKGRDVGLAALFLYLITLHSATTGSTQLILFGSVFTVSSSTLPDVAVLSAIVLLGLSLIQRPLLLSSISVELAAARGIRLRWVGIAFMVMLAAAVGLSAIVIGSILSTALLIGPPASTLKVASRLRSAMMVACALGVVATTLGVVLAYDSYYWFPSRRGLPVSFFVVMIVVIEFALASFLGNRRSKRVVTQDRHEPKRPEQMGWI